MAGRQIKRAVRLGSRVGLLSVAVSPVFLPGDRVSPPAADAQLHWETAAAITSRAQKDLPFPPDSPHPWWTTVMFLILMIGLAWWWWRRGWLRKPSPVSSPVTVTPGETTAFLSIGVTGGALAACLLDLASNGYLSIREVPRQTGTPADWELREIPRNRSELPTLERLTLDRVFQQGSVIRVSALSPMVKESQWEFRRVAKRGLTERMGRRFYLPGHLFIALVLWLLGCSMIGSDTVFWSGLGSGLYLAALAGAVLSLLQDLWRNGARRQAKKLLQGQRRRLLSSDPVPSSAPAPIPGFYAETASYQAAEPSPVFSQPVGRGTAQGVGKLFPLPGQLVVIVLILSGFIYSVIDSNTVFWPALRYVLGMVVSIALLPSLLLGWQRDSRSRPAGNPFRTKRSWLEGPAVEFSASAVASWTQLLAPAVALDLVDEWWRTAGKISADRVSGAVSEWFTWAPTENGTANTNRDLGQSLTDFRATFEAMAPSIIAPHRLAQERVYSNI